MRWNCMSKALRLVHITVEHQDCQFFTVFLTIKTSSQNISITLLQIPLKLHEHRGRYKRKKLPWTILEDHFSVPRNTACSKIANAVISLLWKLQCRCSPDHNKFSYLSNTTVVAIFHNLCLWRRSSCSNLGRYWPWKNVLSHLTDQQFWSHHVQERFTQERLANVKKWLPCELLVKVSFTCLVASHFMQRANIQPIQ